MQSTRPVIALAAAALLGAACQPVEAPTATLTQAQWEEVRKDILKEEPAPKYKVNAVFEDTIEFIGFDVSEPLVPGKTATFTWYWRAKKSTPRNWQIFVHLDSERRPYRQNLDHYPVRGLYNTNRWKPNEIIRDVQEVTISAGYPAGPARPFIGLFIDDTRMSISQALDRTDDSRVRGPVLQVMGADGQSAPDPRPSYAVRAVTGEAGKLTLDGRLDEALWKELPAMRLKPLRSAPALDTWARAYYTEDALVIGAYLADSHIWGTLTARDADTWTEEVLEVFIDTNGDGKDYLELQVTPANVIFDARFEQRLGRGQGTRQEQIDRARAWNMEGLQTAVALDGSLNDEAQVDKNWTVEIVIPFSTMPGAGARPKVGDTWSFNLYRFDVPQPKRSFAYAWSTEPDGDFHQIDKFGRLVFADEAGKLPGGEQPTAPGELQRLVLPPGKRIQPPSNLMAPQAQDGTMPTPLPGVRIDPSKLKRHKVVLPPPKTTEAPAPSP
jgi:hypothetical protein